MKYVFCVAAGIAIGAGMTYVVMSASRQTEPEPAAAPVAATPSAPRQDKPAKRGDIFSGTVKSVHDGDTFQLTSGENIYRIRVWGIDAPELKQTCQKGTETVACGKMTKAALEKILSQGPVTCEYQGLHQQRIISTCTVGGQDISASLIRQGLALEDKSNTKGRYADDESYARRNKLGLWGMTFDQPSHWRACNLPIPKDLRRPADCAPK